MIGRLLLVIGVLTGFAAHAHAGFDDGKAAYDRGDYASAYKEFRAAAAGGNAGALYFLGRMYDGGHGVPQDSAEAFRWYCKAAEQYTKAAKRGNAAAQYFLGNMYCLGQGLPEDYAEALKWYRKAAEQGDAAAQNSLGNMYYLGRGVPRDCVEAAKWYRKAAEHGGYNKPFYDSEWLKAEIAALYHAMGVSMGRSGAKDSNRINELRSKISMWIRKRPSPRIGMTTLEASTTNWGVEVKKNITLTATGVDEQWVFGDPDWCLWPHNLNYHPAHPRFLYFVNGVLTAIKQ